MTQNTQPRTPLRARLSDAISYAISHGITVSQTKDSRSGTALTHAPFTLNPSPLPVEAHAHALGITKPLNDLVVAIANDYPYLRKVLAETANADRHFTGRLMQLLDVAERRPDRILLSICRYDYFVNEPQHDQSSTPLRMVEMNCIAASFASLATRTSSLHRHLASLPSITTTATITPNLPPNEPDKGLARGMSVARHRYEALYKTTNPTIAVVVVQPGERNSFDQDILRFQLWDDHRLQMVRLTLAQISELGSVDAEGRMWVNLEDREELSEVSVVYFRAGYTPDDYPSETEWRARELIESSVAAKCPSVAMQLVGTKKVQQVLDRDGEVEKFIGNEFAGDIRATFAGQYSLAEDEDGEKHAFMAIDRPADFVLKPQREGGGNNLYGDEMKKELLRMSAEERSAYVLMERIRPVIVKNVLVREGLYEEKDIVSEFGVYGVYVGVDGKQVENYVAGTLLRSKAAEKDDGGVAAGVAVLDSPVLVD